MSPDLKVRRRKCNIVTRGEDDEMKMGLVGKTGSL